MPFDEQRAAMASASAALLWTQLPFILALQAADSFAKIRDHLEALLYAYQESLSGRGLPPTPSDN